MQLQFEQLFQLNRVERGIGRVVQDFCLARRGATFHLAELEAYVAERAPTTPGSAGRILRLLRREGHVDVELVSRRQSLYRVAA